MRYDLNSNNFEIISTNETLENEADKLSQPYQTAIDVMGDDVRTKNNIKNEKLTMNDRFKIILTGNTSQKSPLILSYPNN